MKYFSLVLVILLVAETSHASGSHAFLYGNGVMTDLGTLGGPYSDASAINDAGQIVGWSETGSGETHAFLYDGGVMTDLGTLGGTASAAYAINSSGQIAGQASTASGEVHAFLYSAGVMTDLGTLGQLAGYAPFSSGTAIIECCINNATLRLKKGGAATARCSGVVSCAT